MVDRRTRQARGILAIVTTALPEETALDLALEADRERGRPDGDTLGSTRVVFHGSDALARVLPPSSDGLADAYLRGDIDLEGDLMAAISAAGSGRVA